MFGWLRPVRRVTWWIFLATLPFHITPFLCGLFEGIFLARQQRNTFVASIESFAENVESAMQMDFWSVPGAPGIHDVGLAPFYVPQLRNPLDWWERLQLTRYDVDMTDEKAVGESPVELWASLDALYRRVRFRDRGAPWHHWVYLSPSYFHLGDLFFSDWDEAFNELLQYHYANPSLGGAEFHFITSPRSFMCDIWNTRGPALLHLTTETPGVFDYYEMPERQDIPLAAPVFARIIEFPLEPEDTAIMPGVFPGPFEQMRSVTADPYAWERFPPYLQLSQAMLRLADICDEREGTHPQTYGRLIKLEDFIEGALGLEGSMWLGLMHIPGLLMSTAAMAGASWVWDFARGRVQSFLGNGELDKMRANLDEEEAAAAMPTMEDNFMAQMLRDFMDSQEQDIEGILESSPEGKEILDKMWDTVKRTPRNVDEEPEEPEEGEVFRKAS